MKIWEGEPIPEGTILCFQVKWKRGNDALEEWKTVSEIDYYRAMHQEAALVEGRHLIAKFGPVYTNEDGVIRLRDANKTVSRGESNG